MFETITKAERLITVEEAANFFNVHIDTITQWIKGGLLPAFKVNRTYRIKMEDLQHFFEQHTTQKSS